MTRVHFIYAGTPDSQQLQSPYSITRNLYKFLSNKITTVYSMWDSTTLPNIDTSDVIIGHPHYEHNTVVQRIFREKVQCKAKCTIHPLHTNRTEDNMPFDFMAREADKIFSICGPYWYDTIEQTPFRHWKPKITRLDMAVDANHFPFLRKRFRPQGYRRLVYIGSSMPQKNLGFMRQLMAGMPDVSMDWYGGSSDHPLAQLPNVNVIGWVELNANMAQKIINDCDIMINTSISDANPTTLLEARSWGLITACTNESGYYNDPYFTPIELGDLAQSRQNLRYLLAHAPEEELIERVKKSRKEIEDKYNWDRFCNTVWDELQKLL